MSIHDDKTYSQLAAERENDPRFSTTIKELFELKSINAATIEPAIQPWLWRGYIPLETSTLIAGKGGVGKSQFLTWLTSQVSMGEQEFPQGKVIILSAEDHGRYTLIPRLIAVNSNLSNVEIIQSAVDVKSKLKERFICLDQDISLLDKKIKELDNVKLIIIDPITAYLGNVKENHSADVRSFILKLNKLAEDNKLAIMLNTHTRKSSNGESPSSAADEIMGSIAWSNTVRMAFCVTRHHEDNELFVFSVSKTNYKKPETLSYRIKSHDVTIPAGKVETSKIEWQVGKVNMSADEAINKKVYEERCEIDKAKEFILRILSFGSKSKEDIYKSAENEEINQHTLKIARQRLKNDGINIIMEPSQSDRRKFIWYIGK